jgi:hypothetical protein
MVLWLPHLVLENTLCGHDILFAGVISFLIIATIVGRDSDELGVLLLPFLATLGAFPSALDGGFGWCYSVAAGDCFHVAQDESGPNRLLARGVPNGNVKWLLGSFWLITIELVY